MWFGERCWGASTGRGCGRRDDHAMKTVGYAAALQIPGMSLCEEQGCLCRSACVDSQDGSVGGRCGSVFKRRLKNV